MRSAALFISLLAVTSMMAAVDAVFIATALALGGLAALKGAALVGYAAGRHGRYHRRRYYGHGRSYGHRRSYGHGRSYGFHAHYRYGRSVEDDSPAEEGEDLLLSAVGQLDPSGCVLKLLCHTQIKEESTRSFEESILVDMFANGTETLTAYNAAFFYASGVGSKTQDPLACKKYFPDCPLNEDQLTSLLGQAWGCGFDFFDDESGDDDEGGVPQQESEGELLPVVVEEETPEAATPAEVPLVALLTKQSPSA